jgi:exonuclease III/uncharacterized C2H2 Zn-finger protein
MCRGPSDAGGTDTINTRAARGFRPGKGVPLTLGTWNTCGGFDNVDEDDGLMEYCQTETGVDILGIQEVRRDLTSRRGGRILTGGAPPSSDTGSGVALVLSARASARVEVRGESEGSRIVWARFRGNPHDLLVINCYIPHHARMAPSREETLREVYDLARSLLKKGDCLIIMGDFNSKMARGEPGITGKYCMHKKADRGGEIMADMCTDLGLTAASTRFCPGKAALGAATYISIKHRKPSQIDYILVSRRWGSSVQSSKVDWRHSLHRFGHGEKFDHGLLKITFAFKLRRLKTGDRAPDHSKMLTPEFLKKFEDSIPDRPQEGFVTVDSELRAMNEALSSASDTLPRREAQKARASVNSFNTSELYRMRQAEAQGVEYRSEAWREVQQRFRKAISSSRREDKRARLEGIVTSMSEAAAKNNMKAVFDGLKRLGGTHRKASSIQPTKGPGGQRFSSQRELLEAWRVFSAEKFSRPAHDKLKGEMRPLRPADIKDEPNDRDLDTCLAALRKSKACGKDGIPAEVYQRSPKAKAMLFALVKRVWREEDVPAEMVEGQFIMLFKNKGSSDDMSKYRAICLLNHSYKLLSSYLLFRLLKEVGQSLPESQAGFRKRRGCRDNVYILARLIDQVINAEKSCVVTFIDFSAAFDTVSHFFLDQALEESNCGPKCRAIFREIYRKASARVKLRSASGETLLSDPLDVRRGVVQGDIFSPLCFILALSVIMKKHLPPGGIESVGGALGALLDSLEYADDAALLDVTPEDASTRVTALAEGAWQDACMKIAVDKSKAMFPRARVKLDGVTDEEYAAAEFGFTCSFCDRGFPTRDGVRSHQELGWCGFKERAEAKEEEQEYAVDEIVDARGDPAHRWFQVKWEGDWGDDQLSWLHAKDIQDCKEKVEAFWEASGLDKTARLERDGEFRCGQCNQMFKRQQDVKSHQTKSKSKGGCKLREGSRIGTLAEKEMQRRQQKAAQVDLGKVMLGPEELENVFEFKYLGHLFQADGSCWQAVLDRLKIAKAIFSKLFTVWDSKEMHTELKLRLYLAGIVSIVTYGVEAWDMSDKVMTRLRGWNSRCLHVITGRSYRDEAVSPTFDLVASILSRRQKWLGHVLRADEAFLARRVLLGEVQEHKETGRQYKQGTLLAEAPEHASVEELVQIAEERDEWRFWSWLEHWAGAGQQKDKVPSDAWMIASGHYFEDGKWIAQTEW